MNMRTYQRGFTLTELLTIIVIVGVMSVVVLPRFTGNDFFQQRGAQDQVRAALRYTQKVAIAQRRQVSIAISNAAGTDSNCRAELVGGNVVCQVSNNVAVVPAVVNFNALGQPVNAGGAVLGANTALVIGGGGIIVERETGYVH